MRGERCLWTSVDGIHTAGELCGRVITRRDEGVDLATLVLRNVLDDVGGYSESIDAESATASSHVLPLPVIRLPANCQNRTRGVSHDLIRRRSEQRDVERRASMHADHDQIGLCG